MQAFHFEAIDPAGRAVSGVVQADSPREARVQLRARGLLPSVLGKATARERARQPWARGLGAAELSLLTRQLATLLDSGLTMEQALAALIEEVDSPLTREVLAGVKAEIMAGASLATALGSYARSFPEFYRALVHGGEESGALPTVLQHLAEYLDARQALRQKTGLALLYPILVAVVAMQVPKKTIIMQAKAAGIKFTFGTNARNHSAGMLHYGLQMVRECGLTAEDMLIL
jgi:general secretion pathway protein F